MFAAGKKFPDLGPTVCDMIHHVVHECLTPVHFVDRYWKLLTAIHNALNGKVAMYKQTQIIIKIVLHLSIFGRQIVRTDMAYTIYHDKLCQQAQEIVARPGKCTEHQWQYPLTNNGKIILKHISVVRMLELSFFTTQKVRLLSSKTSTVPCKGLGRQLLTITDAPDTETGCQVT